MINGMLGCDTPEKQLKSGITNGMALTLQKLLRNDGVERDGSSNYFPQNVNKPTSVNQMHFSDIQLAAVNIFDDERRVSDVQGWV